MERAAPAPTHRHAVVALLAIAGLLVVLTLLWPTAGASRATLSHGAGAAVALAAGVIATRAGRRRGAWRGTLAGGAVLFLVGLAQAAALVHDLLARPSGPYGMQAWVVAPFAVFAALTLTLYRRELLDHFSADDRREFLADAALLAVAAGAMVFLTVRPAPGTGNAGALATSAAMTGLAMAVVGVSGALALRLPSRMHLGLFVVFALLGLSGLAFAYNWVRGDYLAGGALVDVPFLLGTAGLAALMVVEPTLTGRAPAGTACASLAFVGVQEFQQQAGAAETSAMVILLGVAIGARIVLNQMRGTRAGQELAVALEAKEGALREADEALTRLRELHRSLAASEERLRLLVDAAVDGIVELDARRVIRRANEAFCSMMQLPRERIVGVRWEALAEEIEGTGGSLATLPDTGRAVLPREDRDLHLEASTSELPGPDPGALLVVRDVTAARVADQTIRSLFKFLQDRDEDRTRLLKRTNAAIEAERNRIARDIHDGPVQGVAAATLSLEAVLLMLRGGGVAKAVDTLTHIREELAEETESLRRLMSDLRPPVLDERGLIPALREILARFGRSTGIGTQFASRSLVDIAPDVETLAYRIVQEALTNAGKHSRARNVRVSVEAVAGQLRIEVVDDGVGFDPASAREFLRGGRVGLASMRERTELANGSLLVRSTAGGGTTIVATLPLEGALSRAEPALR
jgi:PAS domain S-box-containing protein